MATTTPAPKVATTTARLSPATLRQALAVHTARTAR